MQRRSFVKLLAGAVCAVAAGIELSLTESLKPQLINGIHPDWLYADYDAAWCFGPDVYKRMSFASPRAELCNA